MDVRLRNLPKILNTTPSKRTNSTDSTGGRHMFLSPKTNFNSKFGDPRDRGSEGIFFNAIDINVKESK